jgi:hypothetical protein
LTHIEQASDATYARAPGILAGDVIGPIALLEGQRAALNDSKLICEGI